MWGTPVYYIDDTNKRQGIKEEDKHVFYCEHQEQAQYQAREARRLSFLQDATKRAEEVEQVIDNSYSYA